MHWIAVLATLGARDFKVSSNRTAAACPSPIPGAAGLQGARPPSEEPGARGERRCGRDIDSMQAAAFGCQRPVPCCARRGLVVRAAAAAEAPPAQQIRIKLKSARAAVLREEDRSAWPCRCKRPDATARPAEWRVRCAGYEKENLAEAVEQVRGRMSHAQLGMLGARQRTQAACVTGCCLRALRAAAGCERRKSEPKRADAQIKSAASSTGARASGPVFLPTRRAPHSLRRPCARSACAVGRG